MNIYATNELLFGDIIRYSLNKFTDFLKSIDLESYRKRFSYIKTVEMDLPRDIQALDSIYEIYWDKNELFKDCPPSFDEYYDYYLNKYSIQIKDFWSKTGFGKECDCFPKGLKARIYRTWASLITQIHAGYVAESVFGEGSVLQSTELDHEGIDIFVIYKNKKIPIQIKKESKRPEIHRMYKGEYDGASVKEYLYIWYIVPTQKDWDNPYYTIAKRKGQLRDGLKPFVKFNTDGTLDRFDNGFVIFTRREFEEIKESIDNL